MTENMDAPYPTDEPYEHQEPHLEDGHAPETPDDPFDALADAVSRLSRLQEGQRTDLDAHTAALEAHQNQLETLEELLKAAPDGPWAWAALDNDAREKLWHGLYDWVSWLEDRYLRHLSPARPGIPDLPADWYRHPVAVELFTSLMVAHIAAYRKKASPPSFALVEWHERCLWPTLARMEALNLFPRESSRDHWDGPEQRPTRRDSARFGEWVTVDTAPAAPDTENRPLSE